MRPRQSAALIFSPHTHTHTVRMRRRPKEGTGAVEQINSPLTAKVRRCHVRATVGRAVCGGRVGTGHGGTPPHLLLHLPLSFCRRVQSRGRGGVSRLTAVLPKGGMGRIVAGMRAGTFGTHAKYCGRGTPAGSPLRNWQALPPARCRGCCRCRSCCCRPWPRRALDCDLHAGGLTGNCAGRNPGIAAVRGGGGGAEDREGGGGDRWDG